MDSINKSNSKSSYDELLEQNTQLKKQIKEIHQKPSSILNELNKVQKIVHIGTWYLDLATNQVEWTEELFKMYGFDPTLPVPPYTEHMKLFTEESWELLSKSLANTAETGIPYELELRTVRKDKSNGWMWVRGETVTDAEGKIIGLWGAARDISKQKKNEAELILKNIVFDTSISANSTSDKNGLLTNVNTAFLNLWGYESSDEVIGKSIAEFIKYEHDATKIINSLNKNEYWSGEYTALKKDGSEFIALANASSLKDVKSDFVGYQSSVIDITDRKQTELELIKAKEKAEENEQKLLQSDRVFNLTLDMFCIAGFDGYFKYLNPAWEKTLGWSIEELLSKPWLDFVHPDDAENTENIKSVIVDGKEIYKFENRYICKDGSIKWFSWNSQPFPKENIMIGAVRDITETKKNENELVNAKLKAEESDKLKSAFLANMSHEIRTPMNGILGFTNLLLDPELTGEEQQIYIEIIQKSGDRLLNTVNDIIEISKIESGDINVTKSEVDLIGHLDTLVTFFKPEAEKKNIHIIVQNSIDGNGLFIQTDKNKISSILSNLIKNAIKYTNAGTIKVGLKVENNQILFTCQDTGTGIPKIRQEAIFNRFEQADIEDKHARQGSGLGLAIVKSYVEMLDGEIWVDSEEGLGSTFYVSLPYEHEEKKEQIIPQEVKSSDSGIKNINVLIVEDDKYSSMHLSVLMKGKVKNIKTAENGIEAIDACKNDSGIDLILMDIKMPVMGGIEATKRIREFNKGVVIIAQTAYAFAGDIEKVLEAGCNDYISKPINKDKLFELINKYF